MNEFIQVLKGLWTHDDFSFHGDFYHVEHGSVPTKSVRAPHPPIYAASSDEEGMSIVAQECETWFVNYDKDHRLYGKNLKRIEKDLTFMEERTRALGRRIGYGINAYVVLGETDAQAEAIADEHVELVRSDPLTAVGSAGIGAALVGSRRTVVERIRRYEAMGIDLLMLQFMPVRKGLEEFAELIMPEIGAKTTNTPAQAVF
jgi:dimethylsulfone monooxygenase